MKHLVLLAALVLASPALAQTSGIPISQLPQAGAITGNETLPMVQSGTTVKSSLFSLYTPYNSVVATLTNKTLVGPSINGAALSGTFSGSPSYSGVPTFTGLSTGVQAFCMGLDGANHVILASGGCGGGGGGGSPGGNSTTVQFNNGGVFGGADGFTYDGAASISLGVAGTSVGSVGFRNATSGTIKVQAPTGALGANVLTLPLATDTLVGRNTTDTLTNKTLTTPTINGGTLSGIFAGAPNYSGVPVFSGLSVNTQVSCMGLDIANHVVLTSAGCGAGGGSAITQLTGDVTAGPGSGSQVATLANTTVAAGSYGDNTHVSQVTFDGKGRATGAASVAINFPAGSGNVTAGTAGQLAAYAASGATVSGFTPLNGLVVNTSTQTVGTTFVQANIAASCATKTDGTGCTAQSAGDMGNSVMYTGAGATVTLSAVTSSPAMFEPGQTFTVNNNTTSTGSLTVTNSTGLTPQGWTSPLTIAAGGGGTFVANVDGLHIDFDGGASAGGGTCASVTNAACTNTANNFTSAAQAVNTTGAAVSSSIPGTMILSQSNGGSSPDVSTGKVVSMGFTAGSAGGEPAFAVAAANGTAASPARVTDSLIASPMLVYAFDGTSWNIVARMDSWNDASGGQTPSDHGASFCWGTTPIGGTSVGLDDMCLDHHMGLVLGGSGFGGTPQGFGTINTSGLYDHGSKVQNLNATFGANMAVTGTYPNLNINAITRANYGGALLANQSQATTSCYVPNGTSAAQSTCANAYVLAPADGTIKRLYASSQTAPSSGQTVTFTVYVNGSGSIVTCQATNSTPTCNDTSDTVNVSAGQGIAMQIATSATSGTIAGANWGFELDTPQTGGGACSNAFDFSAACNSQFLPLL